MTRIRIRGIGDKGRWRRVVLDHSSIGGQMRPRKLFSNTAIRLHHFQPIVTYSGSASFVMRTHNKDDEWVRDYLSELHRSKRIVAVRIDHISAHTCVQRAFWICPAKLTTFGELLGLVSVRFEGKAVTPRAR